MKALPSSYNRDIQEDKKALFDSVETIQSALEVFAAMLPELKINRKRMENAARDSSLLATDLAEYLVKKGTPFREAHQIVGELVVHSIAKSVPLDQIAVAEMKKFSPHFDDDVAKIFDVPAIRWHSDALSALRRPRTSRRRSSAGANWWRNL